MVQELTGRELQIWNNFQARIQQGGKQSPVISATDTLIETIKNSAGATVNELLHELMDAIKILERIEGKSKLAVHSSCAQFLRYATINLATTENQTISDCKNLLQEEGGKYLKRCQKSIARIAQSAAPFIFDGAKVLVHSNSQVVLNTLKAVPENMQFSVWFTYSEKESCDNFQKQLQQSTNIRSIFIHDSEIGYIMETIDLVLVGAESVVKNGGILNKVGTLSVAICAKEMNKPLYVLAESFKFSLIYPLNQKDIPKNYRYDENGKVRIDYTPPKYLTMLITDRGLLTPTAVCDELIEMYV